MDDMMGPESDRLAFVAIVEIRSGGRRRHVYLNLPAAQRAVERAESRGCSAEIILCELVQVGAAIDGTLG